MSKCEHGVPATLPSDVEYLARYGSNPDCIYCPSIETCECGLPSLRKYENTCAVCFKLVA